MTLVVFSLPSPSLVAADFVPGEVFDDHTFRVQQAVFKSVGARWRKNRWVFAQDRLFDAVLSARLAGLRCLVSKELRPLLHAAQEARRASPAPPFPPPPGLSIKAHQHEGIAWIRSRRAQGKGALLADDMGLGKSAQTLLSLDLDAAALVVCPAVARGVWLRECRLWRPDIRPVVIESAADFRWPSQGELVILSYGVLPLFERVGGGLSFPRRYGLPEGPVTVIPDECQLLKAWAARRAKSFRCLAATAQHFGGTVVLLSGTPLLNRPVELWTVLQAAGLAKEAFDDFATFKKCFRASKGKNGKVRYGSADHTVPHRLARVMLRRKKADVLDLPPKVYDPIEVEVPLSAADQRALDMLLRALGIKGDLVDADLLGLAVSERVPFHILRRAQQVLAVAKIPATLQLVAECEGAGQPAVVFSAFQAVAQAVSRRKGWASLTGQTPAKQRTALEEAFQRGELRGLAVTIRAGGTALTLTRASRAIFNDLDWTPAANMQAEDRIYRIGQTRSVQITRLIAAHPVDRRIAELLGEKMRLIHHTVDAAGRVLRADVRDDEPAAQVEVEEPAEAIAEAETMRGR